MQAAPAPLPSCMQLRILERMQTTSVRIDRDTHQELRRLAEELQLSVGETVRYAVRRLQQSQIGSQLADALTEEEVQWLDADFG